MKYTKKTDGKKGRFIKYGILVLLMWYGINIITIYQYSDTTFEIKSDVAIVLGAGSSNGQVSPVFRERLNHAIHLFNYGLVSKIIVTRGYGDNEVISDSRSGKNYLIEQNIPDSVIYIENQSSITYENLTNAQQIMQQYQLNSALVVSDAYHEKRALEMCKKLGMNALPSPTPSSMYRSFWPKKKLLLSEALNYCGYQIYGRFRKNS